MRVSSRIEEQVYEVLVEDNVPGIRSEERELIFTKFRRGWAVTRAPQAGAGLGLAISWQIMRRLGDSLILLPDRGSGACFHVTLTGWLDTPGEAASRGRRGVAVGVAVA